MMDLRLLSAPEMQGRRTGTDGGRRARAFVASRFAELSLQALRPGYLQAFQFDHVSVRAIFKRNRPVRMRFDAANVVGLIPGRDPQAGTIVLSAHYDHLGVRDGQLYPGADDNASGVAVMLEVARWLRTNPLRHDVLCVAFDAEELGLRGAQAFVADWPVPRERLRLAVNLDMVGRSEERTLVAAGAYHTPALQPLLEELTTRTPVRLRLGHDRPRWLAGSVDDWTDASDQGPLHDAGLPFLYFGVDDHEDYHQPSDTPDKVAPDFLHDVAELVLDALMAVDARAPLR